MKARKVITPRKMEEILGNILEFLDEKNVDFTPDLENILGKKILAQKRNATELIDISRTYYKGNPLGYSMIYTISHNWDVYPFSAFISQELSSSSIFIAFRGDLDGYDIVDSDRFGNILHKKFINSSDIAQVKNEILRLKNDEFK